MFRKNNFYFKRQGFWPNKKGDPVAAFNQIDYIISSLQVLLIFLCRKLL